MSLHTELDRYWRQADRSARDARTLQRARLALDLLGASAPRRLLDLGCGPGVAAQAMVAAGWQVQGVDGSPAAVYEARRRGIRADLADLDRWEPDGSVYDAVLALEVLEHLDDPGRLLARAREALAPAGAAVFSIPHERHLLRRIGHPRRPGLGVQDPAHRHCFDLASSRAILERCGWTVQDYRDVPLAPPRPRALGPAGRTAARVAPGLFALARVYRCVPA